jgi:hypothetical protein
LISNKEKYRLLCQSEQSIPIFLKDWWLDAVCGNSWDVCLVTQDDEIRAAMPYYFSKNKLGHLVLSHPMLTPFLGPWLKITKVRETKKLSEEKKYLNKLIEGLPKFGHFEQNWHYLNINWLPFYWNNFQQTTRYTYRINDISDLSVVWNNLNDNIKREINKAKNRFKLIVRQDLSIDDFLELNEKTFRRQGMEMPYSKFIVNQIDKACKSHRSSRLFIAEDENGKRHAGVYIIWDEQSAYYLLGGGDPELRTSGASSLCMWEAIKFASSVSESFDFEGSMIEPIERFVSSFGATQTPYFAVSKTPSILIAIRRFIDRLQNQ